MNSEQIKTQLKQLDKIEINSEPATLFTVSHFNNRKKRPCVLVNAGLERLYIYSTKLQVVILAPQQVVTAEIYSFQKQQFLTFSTVNNTIYCIKLPKTKQNIKEQKYDARATTSGNHDIFSDLLSSGSEDMVLHDVLDSTLVTSVTEVDQILKTESLVNFAVSQNYFSTVTSASTGYIINVYSLEKIVLRKYPGLPLATVYIPHLHYAQNGHLQENVSVVSVVSNIQSNFIASTCEKIVSQGICSHLFGDGHKSGLLISLPGGALYGIPLGQLINDTSELVPVVLPYRFVYHMQQEVVHIHSMELNLAGEISDDFFITGNYGKLLQMHVKKDQTVQIVGHVLPSPVTSVCSGDKCLVQSTGQELYVHQFVTSEDQDNAQVQFHSQVFHVSCIEKLAVLPTAEGQVKVLTLGAYGTVCLATLEMGDTAGMQPSTSVYGSSGVMKDLLTSISQVTQDINHSKMVCEAQDQALQQLAVANTLHHLYCERAKNAEKSVIDSTMKESMLRNPELLTCSVKINRHDHGYKAAYSLMVKLVNTTKTILKGSWIMSVRLASLQDIDLCSVAQNIPFSNLHPGQFLELAIPLDFQMLNNLPLVVKSEMCLPLGNSITDKTLPTSQLYEQKRHCLVIPVKDVTIDLLHILAPMTGQQGSRFVSTAECVRDIARTRPGFPLHRLDQNNKPGTSQYTITVPIPNSFFCQLVENHSDQDLKLEVLVLQKLLEDSFNHEMISSPSVKLCTPQNRHLVLSVQKSPSAADGKERFQLQVHAASQADLAQLLMAVHQRLKPYQQSITQKLSREQATSYQHKIQEMEEKLLSIQQTHSARTADEGSIMKALIDSHHELEGFYLQATKEAAHVITLD